MGLHAHSYSSKTKRRNFGAPAPGRKHDGNHEDREERRQELKRLGAMPNRIDKLYSVLTRNFITFEKLPIGTLMTAGLTTLPSLCPRRSTNLGSDLALPTIARADP